jgi:hypothetical protein
LSTATGSCVRAWHRTSGATTDRQVPHPTPDGGQRGAAELTGWAGKARGCALSQTDSVARLLVRTSEECVSLQLGGAAAAPAQAPGGVPHQQRLHQLHRHGGEELRKLELAPAIAADSQSQPSTVIATTTTTCSTSSMGNVRAPENVGAHRFGVLGEEGDVPGQHLVQQASEGPPVHGDACPKRADIGAPWVSKRLAVSGQRRARRLNVHPRCSPYAAPSGISSSALTESNDTISGAM